MTILEVARETGFNEGRLGEPLSVWDVRDGSGIWILWHEPAKGGFDRGMCLFRRDLHWFETIEQRRVGFDNAGEPLVTNINVVVTIPEDEQTESERRYEVYKRRDSPDAFDQQRAQWYVQDFSKGHVIAWWGDSQFYEDELARSSKRLDQSLIG